MQGSTDGVKNIVFDLGRVLVKWYPDQYLAERYGQEVAAELTEKIFDSQEWIEMDRGALSEDELWELKLRELPHRKAIIEEIREHTIELLEEITDNTRLLPVLKEMGYKLYVLSNFSAKMFEKVRAKYGFFRYFDGLVISSHHGHVKPDPRLYEILIGKYAVKPQESLFIDDKLENVLTAERLGFKVLHLPDWRRLPDELRRLGYLQHVDRTDAEG